MPTYRESVALVSSRHTPSRRASIALVGVERYASPYYVVGAPNASAQQLINAAPPSLTRGAQLGIPAIPGISGPRSVSIPAHVVPGAAEVMNIAGISPADIPTDAAGAIKAGLQVAGQVAGKLAGPMITAGLNAIMPGVVSAVSAVTASLGIGQGLGSVVPGIGNLVGLAITGLVAAVKAIIGLFKGREQCDFDPKCPDLAAKIANLSPVDALPVIAKVTSDTSRRLAREAVDEDCYLEPKKGKGGKTFECIRYMLATFDQVYYFAKDTPEVMGVPQIDRLLPAYRSMPTRTYTAEFRGDDRVVPHYSITEKKARHAANDVSITAMIAKMEKRRAYLVDLERKVQEAQQDWRKHFGVLRMYVVTELRRATENYVFSQSPEMEAWLRTVGGWMNVVIWAEKQRDEGVQQHIQAQERRKQEIARMPPAQRKQVMDADRIAQLKWKCSEADGKGPACDELRKMQGLPTAAQANPQAAALKKLYNARNYYIYKKLQTAASRGNVTAREVFKRATSQPGITRANLFERVYQYLDAQAKAGDKAAKFIVEAGNREFKQKLQQAAQQGGASSGYGLVLGAMA